MSTRERVAIAAITQALEEANAALTASVKREMELYEMSTRWIVASEDEAYPLATRATYASCVEELCRIMAR